MPGKMKQSREEHDRWTQGEHGPFTSPLQLKRNFTFAMCGTQKQTFIVCHTQMSLFTIPLHVLLLDTSKNPPNGEVTIQEYEAVEKKVINT
jgi:hypothetical protein